MKTIFALLGLFMFASVSTTNVQATSNDNDAPVLTQEDGELGRKILIRL
ncbi:MAG: hypothetical protein ACK4RM_09545 [Flavobacterium sp.]|jgi:hypothetical protein